MSFITKISQARKQFTELTPKEVKSERNTKIKIFAAAVFVLIALGASIYLLQHSTTIHASAGGKFATAGALLLGGAIGAGIILSIYALERKDAESQKFPRGECPDLSDDETKQARITLLNEGSLKEVYEQLYGREVGVRPYVQAGLLTAPQGDELLGRLRMYSEHYEKMRTAKADYFLSNPLVVPLGTLSFCGGQGVERGLAENRAYQNAKEDVDRLETSWRDYQRTLFLPKLIDVRLDAADIRLV